jgi:hypothetical protein
MPRLARRDQKTLDNSKKEVGQAPITVLSQYNWTCTTYVVSLQQQTIGQTHFTCCPNNEKTKNGLA